VLAIDPEAPNGEIFQAVSLQDLSDPGPFDAVVANRALHHITDLGEARDKIAALLPRGGRLILSEHACDRLDEPTARWYFGHRAAFQSAAPRSLDECLAEWQDDHVGLHGYEVMRQELDRRFAERFFAWTPYLYREFDGAVEEREERELIEAGRIQAMGFRYVGEPKQ
jgi:SAM-dependent methyltransferase